MNKDSFQENNRDLKPRKSLPVFEIAGVILGGIGGFLYYNFVGCYSGACPLQSNPWIASVWGGLIGYLFADVIKPAKKSKKEL